MIAAVGLLAATRVYHWAFLKYDENQAIMMAVVTLGWFAFATIVLNQSDEDGNSPVTFFSISAAYGAGWFISNKYGEMWGIAAAAGAFFAVWVALVSNL